MSMKIRSIGTAVPEYSASQEHATEVAKALCCSNSEQRSFVENLYRQTEIKSRHMVLGEAVVRDLLEGNSKSGSCFVPHGKPADYAPSTQQRMKCYREYALPLARSACAQAIAQSDMRPEDVTHLILVSCTGFAAPGVDLGLISSLGLPNTTQRVQVGFMGCHGAINGLRVARGLAAVDASVCILLCAVELCSLHYFYGWDPKKLVANALFADGAAAIVALPTLVDSEWRLTDTGSCVFPGTESAMSWNIGDCGFEMALSTRVPSLIAENLNPWLSAWLQTHRLQISDIGSWAVHPGGPRILDAVEKGLVLDASALTDSRLVLGQFGNMSSPTVLFVVDRLRRRNAPLPCVALGFGPGLAVESALFR